MDERRRRRRALRRDLLAACDAGSAAGIARVLESREARDAGLGATDRFGAGGQTPLMRASKRGHEEAVRALLERGADADAEPWSGERALVVAARLGHAGVVRLLLPQPVSCPRAAKDALAAALRNGHEEAAVELITHGGGMWQPGERRRSPLREAALRGARPRVVRAMLERGAADEENRSGCRVGAAVELAAAHGHAATLEAMLDGGVRGLAAARELRPAARQGHLDSLRVLLLRRQYGREALGEAVCMAAAGGHAQVVAFLVDEAGAPAEGSWRDRPGIRPSLLWPSGSLHFAALGGHARTFFALLKRGANAVPRERSLLLAAAIQSSVPAAARVVLRTGLSRPCAADLVAAARDPPMLRVLLGWLGAGHPLVTKPSPRRRVTPPLVAAARAGCAEAVRELLDHGAPVNGPPDPVNGHSAFAAALCGLAAPRLECARLLIARGADTTTCPPPARLLEEQPHWWWRRETFEFLLAEAGLHADPCAMRESADDFIFGGRASAAADAIAQWRRSTHPRQAERAAVRRSARLPRRLAALCADYVVARTRESPERAAVARALDAAGVPADVARFCGDFVHGLPVA